MNISAKACILLELGHLAYNQITHHRLDFYVSKRLNTPVIKRNGKNKTFVKNPKAGITRRIRFYDFRHAAITQMILKGDLKAASEIAGHSNIEMTIRQYEHITSKIKRKTVGAIEEI